MKKSLIIIGFLFISISFFAQNIDKKTQANFIFGFGRLMHWQDYNDNEILVNVYGNSSVTDYVNTLALSNRVSGRKVLAKETGSSIGNCNILYIPADKINSLSEIVPQLQGKSIIVVSDQTGYLDMGVDIEFDYKKISATDSVISYRYNPISIRNKNIKISPEFKGYSIDN